MAGGAGGMTPEPDFPPVPTFEASRQRAFRLLGDAADELRSDWRPDHSPTPRQLAATHTALAAINVAKTSLDVAARR